MTSLAKKKKRKMPSDIHYIIIGVKMGSQAKLSVVTYVQVMQDKAWPSSIIFKAQ